MSKVLIIGIGGQGEKYINYFLKNNFEVYGVSKTTKTSDKISKKYGIQTYISYANLLDRVNFDIIIICLPPEIQGQVSLEVSKKIKDTKIIVEIPVCWSVFEIEKLSTIDNIYFFYEEYFTLFSKTVSSLGASKIKDIDIKFVSSKDDYENILARKVSYIHILNNFLSLNINLEKISFSNSFHNREDIFYEISFKYAGKSIKYIFNEEKKLIIGDKVYTDKYCFDFVLSEIINGGFDNYFLKKSFLKNMKYLESTFYDS